MNEKIKCEGKLIFVLSPAFTPSHLPRAGTSSSYQGIKISKTELYNVCFKKKRKPLIRLVGVPIGNISAADQVFTSCRIELFGYHVL